jgi:hypothetical protein
MGELSKVIRRHDLDDDIRKELKGFYSEHKMHIECGGDQL